MNCLLCEKIAKSGENKVDKIIGTGSKGKDMLHIIDKVCLEQPEKKGTPLAGRWWGETDQAEGKGHEEVLWQRLKKQLAQEETVN